MADRYWVGGAGTWDATTTTNWSASSGGAGGASAPTSADNVIFDTLSNATAYAVTVGTNANALDVTIAGPLVGNVTITSGATAVINCYGSWTNAATGVVFTSTSGSNVNFLSTTTGKTITTNNVTLSTLQVTLNGVGGEWSLGSAFTSTTNIIITAGTFTTTASNYAISAGQIASNNANIRSISLNASAVILTGTTVLNFSTATNLTFSAGTSTITCSGASPTFAGGAQTFNNVTFSSTATGTTTIQGTNTFNVLTQAAQAAAGLRFVAISANQTISTLTLSAGASAVTRTFVRSDTVGTQRTLTVGTLTAISDVDFRDIVAAGASAASPWTGTRLGNCKNNSNITFAAGTTKYWSTVNGASASWSGTAWATSSGGVPAVANFPLAQDTVIIDNSGATVGDGLRTGNTVTIDALWNMGTLNFSGRTVAFNWTQGNQDPVIYGDVTLTTAMTMATVTGTPTWTFANQGTVQALNSAGVTLRLQNLTINSPGGGVSLTTNTAVDLSPIVAPNVTGTVTLTAGTLTLNNNTLTSVFFSTSSTQAHTLAFGTGNITLTGTGTIFTGSTTTTVTGTPQVICTDNSATSRTITPGVVTEANSISFRITAGTGNLVLTAGAFRDLDFTDGINPTGFAGFLTNTAITVYGNFKASTGMTQNFTTAAITFAATSGTKTIDTAGVAFDRPFTFNGVGGTWQLQADFIAGPSPLGAASVRTVTLLAGTLNLASFTLTTGIFVGSSTSVRTLAFGTGKIALAGTATTLFSTATSTNLTVTGTNPLVQLTDNSTTSSRGITMGNSGEANAISVEITAGSDTIGFGSTSGSYKNISAVGFTGVLNFSNNIAIYGNFDVGGATAMIGGGDPQFLGASGTKTIRSNGLSFPDNISFNGVGATWTCLDALSVITTLTLTEGTLKLKAGTTNTVGGFATSGTNQKFLQSDTPSSQATLSQASGTVSVNNLTIQDSAATGGATWLAYVVNLNIDAGNNTGWVFFNNIYTRTVTESSAITDSANVGVTFNATVTDLATLSDSTSSGFLWNLIDDAQTPNWQNINTL